MKVVVIGASGFVGRHVAARLAAMPEVGRLTLLDRVPYPAPAGPRIEALTGDFADPATRARLIDGADKVILLAAILGGAAEADYALARRVNLDAALDLADALAAANPSARLVFASTIAALSHPLPDPVTDETPLSPTLVYGAQKVMMEIALSNFAARGWLDAVSLRPAGVMARDGADAGLKSAFLSRLFWSYRRGEDITLPVAPDSRSWLSSVRNVARNFVHAAMLPEIGPDRAFTLPALAPRFDEIAAALAARYPGSPARITYAPEADMVRLFGSFPQLQTPIAERLGFTRDRDVAALVANAMTDETEEP